MSAGLVPVSRRPEWVNPALLILLTLVPAIAGTMRLAELASGAAVTEANARFFAAPLPVVVHVLVVIPYGILGALQFAPGFRRRHRTWHRNAGKALLVLGLVAALTGLWMTLSYPWPAGDGVALYVERLVFGPLMLFSLVRAALAIPRREFVSHGEWMTRAYAIGLGAGTQVLTHLPWFLLVGKPGETARGVLMGAGWVINVVFAEWLIRRQREEARRARTDCPVRSESPALPGGSLRPNAWPNTPGRG
ncbi:MAG: DUF2306 domain-containing protein [Candidatus Eisenbacteria bacterium]|nr:DUF2306 domain-containing protein [Candidatus Eisenbacteria bacterium]